MQGAIGTADILYSQQQGRLALLSHGWHSSDNDYSTQHNYLSQHNCLSINTTQLSRYQELFRWCLFRTIPWCACAMPQMIPAVGCEWHGGRQPDHCHLADCSLLTMPLGKDNDFGIFKCWFCHLPVMLPWTSDFNLFSLKFLECKMIKV